MTERRGPSSVPPNVAAEWDNPDDARYDEAPGRGLSRDEWRTPADWHAREHPSAEGRTPSPGPWCPVCRQPVPETGMAWTFPPHGGCEGEGRKVRDADHGFVTEDGRTVPEWEFR